MVAPLSVNIIYNKTNTYGLNDDVLVIERILKKLQDVIGHPITKAKTVDIREPLTQSDIQIHLEVPVFSAVPWAHTNIIIVNPEQWSFAYDAYVHAFDALIFRDQTSADIFSKDFKEKGIPTDNIFVVPWCASWQVKDIKSPYGGADGFVSFLAGSKSKFNYMKDIVSNWTESDPSLTIYTTRNDFVDELTRINLPNNITIKQQELDSENRYQLMTMYRGHIVCSQGEAFGYAAANSEVAGAFTIMNSLPIFRNMYDTDYTNYTDNVKGVYWISNEYKESDNVRYSTAHSTSHIRQELEEAFKDFKKANLDEIRKIRQAAANDRFSATCTSFLTILRQLQTLVKDRRPSKGLFHCPPVLHSMDCPPISIITPTYNREKLIDIAFHNLLVTDYPHDKIEWIVIEDNEKTPHLASEKIISFQIQVPKIKLKYIPIEGRMTIGEKRNHAIEHASNDIILFMDDDDHYPETSFRRRVAWLTKGTKRGQTGKANIACCTTIALYDLKKGISAVNVPPFNIPFAQRISEATLTFRKSAWIERKFPDLSISEGESWISGREDQVIEIPPQQIIVAFSHDHNQTTRRIPPVDQKPACFWGFPREYLVFIHGLVGVQIEDDKSAGKQSKR